MIGHVAALMMERGHQTDLEVDIDPGLRLNG